jgi:flagellar basal body P-ring formation protein FlgA
MYLLMPPKSRELPMQRSEDSQNQWATRGVIFLTSWICRQGSHIGKLAPVMGIAILISTVAVAETVKLNEIQRAARELIARDTQAIYPGGAQIEVGQVDSRLRLAPCGQGLNAFTTPGSRLLGTVHVGVRCSGDRPWLVYVPVKITVQDIVLVASRPLPRGHLLTQQDFAVVKQDIKDLPAGYLREVTAVVGKQLKQPIMPGAVLTGSSLEQNALVKRGDTVTIVAQSSGIEVRAAGQALSNAGLGQAVEVRNLSSKRSIRATVTGPGMVQVEL